MKKFFTKIISLLTVAIISTGILSGCSLIVTDVEKDMALEVATVSLDENLKDTIYKKDMVNAYTSNAYYYQYYGTSNKDAYEEIMKSLTQNSIIVQQSIKALTTTTEEAGNTEKSYFLQASEVLEANRTSKEKVLTTKNYLGADMTTVNYVGYSTANAYQKAQILDDFLTTYEYNLARYNFLVTVDSLIEQFMEAEENEELTNESLAITNRTTLTIPTQKDGNEYEIKNDAELSKITNEYKKEVERINRDYGLGIEVSSYTTKYDLANKLHEEFFNKFDIITKARKKALTKLINQLKKIGYITEEEAKTVPSTKEDLIKISFFANALKSQYETLIVAKYRLALVNQQEKSVTDDNLYVEYKTMFDSQKTDFDKSNANYEAKLEEVSETNFIAYNPNYGAGKVYGYVANLLIGFNKEQQALVDSFTNEPKYTDAQKTAYVNDMLKYIKAKDLRQTWVLSNYGTYDEASKQFTFKSDYVKTDLLNKFDGEIIGAKAYQYYEESGEKATAYTYKSIREKEYTFSEFINGTFKNVMGVTPTTTVQKLAGAEEDTYVATVIKDEIMDKFRDLIYAYSTDDGSLNEGYGYLYSPMGTDFVKEFEDTQKALIDNGVGSYAYVVTNYGYHVMLCTKVIKPTETCLTAVEFKNEVAKQGTMPYEFKQYKIENISSSTVSNIILAFINRNFEKDGVVTKYESAYSDLIK